MKNSIKLSSFKEAFECFLSYCDDSVQPESIIKSFETLKKEGKMKIQNDTEFWNGNHCQSSSTVELYLINEPLRFYVVRYDYWEVGRHIHGENNRTETHVFVPEE